MLRFVLRFVLRRLPGAFSVAVHRPACPAGVGPYLGAPCRAGGGRRVCDRGVRVAIVRLAPSVHGAGDYGFVPRLVQVARDKGVAAYVGDGANRWSAVHRDDAAVLFRLAVESATSGAVLHGVAEEEIATRDIAATIGRNLGVPVTSIPIENEMDHFGWIGAFFSLDIPASSALTRQRFGWQPTGIGLLDDMNQHYF